MSFLQFTFRPTLIPAYAQAEFLSRFAQLVLDYETLIEPAPPSPPAEAIPPPTSFVPVAGDGAEGEVAPAEVKPKKRGPKRKMGDDSLTPKTLEQMTARELQGRLGGLMGIPADSPFPNKLRNKFPNKTTLIAEIRRLQAEPAPAPAPVPQPVAEAVVENTSVAPSEAPSDASATKRPRKNAWAEYTPEQKAARLALMAEKRLAKVAARQAAAQDSASDGNTSV